jgi:UDP-N-acetyl-D-mannosaminuronic acid transferase (WecB/TagA/CpsF family)
MTVEANRSPIFNKVLLDADMVCPDGVPLLFANKVLNSNRVTERFAGMDVISDLLNSSQKNFMDLPMMS